jgi:hypothetical protein
MQVGEVRVAEDADFEKLRTLCLVHEDWKQDYNKNTTTVWTRSSEQCDFKMIKIRGLFSDVSAATVFDVLNDPVYRTKWDFNMIEAYEVCQISPNNDIGYYAMKAKPLKNRDFVTQRSWLDLGNEYLIFNHSVNHASLPPKKGFVRGISYLTGYHITPTTGSCDKNGVQIFYITQSDPKGKLPVWAVNKAAQILAPKVMSKLHKACKGYDGWKAKHNPGLKPWLFPEQNTLPKLNLDDIRSMDEATAAEAIDETDAIETVDEENDLKIPDD